MNTYMTFTAYGETAGVALEEAVDLVEKVEDLWSVTDTGSEIYAANHSGGRPIPVSRETAELVSFRFRNGRGNRRRAGSHSLPCAGRLGIYHRHKTGAFGTRDRRVASKCEL